VTTQLVNQVVTSLRSAMSLLSVSFYYLGAQRVPLQNLLQLLVLPNLQFLTFI